MYSSSRPVNGVIQYTTGVLVLASGGNPEKRFRSPRRGCTFLQTRQAPLRRPGHGVHDNGFLPGPGGCDRHHRVQAFRGLTNAAGGALPGTGRSSEERRCC
ncbi:hypothetical protein GCM10011581_06850 [Saccharopolyspora subtropica]|uniref:Uncharacterized protein n=1 Tax=Saccharopolyspora thermophila TaxID=89367 RepID=A0A917JK09_9PSEU|nr:hypothetical protein GCM10011581_06850 [Saccharopolyspora subtropica]